jgi:hypothetical protein
MYEESFTIEKHDLAQTRLDKFGKTACSSDR